MQLGIWGLILWLCLDEDDLEYNPSSAPNAQSIYWGILSLSTGAVSVAFAEMTVKVNHITFPNTHLTDSGQLIALLIGAITLLGTMISPFRPPRRSEPRPQVAA